jgi:hypothetical protein
MFRFSQNVKIGGQHMGWLLDVSPFFMLQTYLDLQIFMFSSFFDPILKLAKSDTPIFQTG